MNLKKIKTMILRKLFRSHLQNFIIHYRNELRVKNVMNPRTAIELQIGLNNVNDNEFIEKFIGNL